MVEARFAATEIEMRLLIALSAQLDKEQGCVMVSAKDLGNMIHLNSKNAYRELKKSQETYLKKRYTSRLLISCLIINLKKKIGYICFHV